MTTSPEQGRPADEGLAETIRIAEEIIAEERPFDGQLLSVAFDLLKSRAALPSVWRPIAEAPRDGTQVLLIGPYPHGKGWSDIYHSWWDKFLDDCTGSWSRWPHMFAPTHFKDATPPSAEAEGGAA